MAKQKYLSLVKSSAEKIEKETGISWKALIAISALETGWGRFVCKDSKNLFNIKGKGPAGSVTVKTREWYTPSKWESLRKQGIPFELTGRESTNRTKTLEGFVHDHFRAYNSYDESFADFVRLISEAPRYKKSYEARRDPKEFVRLLHAAGYATDPKYSDKLISIINNL